MRKTFHVYVVDQVFFICPYTPYIHMHNMKVVHYDPLVLAFACGTDVCEDVGGAGISTFYRRVPTFITT